LQAVLEYSRDLFDDSTAIRLLRHLETLLASAVAEPRTRVSELGLLPDDELAALVAHGNDIGTAYPERCVHELIAAGVHRFGDRVAVSGPNGELTYSELEEQSNRLARRLRALGVGRDVLVGICLERRVELLVAVLATWKAGGAYVPLDPAYPRERLAEMLADARAPVLVTESALVELLPSREASLVVVDTDDGRAADESTAPLDLAGHDPDQLAYVIYTSGSTGPPKGVEIPHRALVNFLFSMLERPGFGPDDVLLAVTTFSFDIAGLELYLPLLAGGRTVFCPTGTQQDPRALAAAARDVGRDGDAGDADDVAPARRGRMARRRRAAGPLRRRGRSPGARRRAARPGCRGVDHVRADGDDDLVHMRTPRRWRSRDPG